MFEYIMSAIAPHICLGCRREGSLLCHQCSTELPPAPQGCYRCGHNSPATKVCTQCAVNTPLESVQIVTRYEGWAKDLVHKLKFERAKAAVAPIAQLLASRVESEGVIVVPVPTAAMRARQRGYDQAELIARRVARITGLPYSPVLARSGKQRQLGQNREHRQLQLQGAYRSLQPDLSKHQHVLLIDDVLTTGSTLEAAAAVLRQAGAPHVSAAVFAAA